MVSVWYHQGNGFAHRVRPDRAMSVKHMHCLNLRVRTGQLFETVPPHEGWVQESRQLMC